MTAKQILKELEPLGGASYKKVLVNHGVSEPVFGVKIDELKKYQKRIRMDYQLALDLYDSGVYDAQYLAGLIADDKKMTRKDLEHWLAKANSPAICEYTVAWVTAASDHAHELAIKWIDSKDESTAQAGWATLSSMVSITDDAELDLAELKRLLKRVEQSIHQAPNRVRYAMNGFVISAGIYVRDLKDLAVQTGERIGEVTVDMSNTACQVPYAPDYIRKAEKRGVIGRKRKTAKC
jgi:3-methyladenine DNA glycosylase AlkD